MKEFIANNLLETCKIIKPEVQLYLSGMPAVFPFNVRSFQCSETKNLFLFFFQRIDFIL